MKLRLAAAAARVAADAVSRIVDPKSSTEAGRNARLSVSGPRLELSSIDTAGGRSVWTSIPAENDGDDGEVLVSAEGLATALRVAKGDSVILTTADDRATLSSNRQRLQLPAYPLGLYPERWSPPAEWVALPAAAVSRLVGLVKCAMHADPTTSIAGVRLARVGSRLSATARNSGWLAFASAEIESGPPLEVTIPRGALVEDKRDLPYFLGHEEGELEIAIDSSRVWCRSPGSMFACALGVGEYPSTAMAHQLEFGTSARADRRALLAAVKGVDALTEESTTIAIALTPESVELAKYLEGLSRDSVPARLSGPPARAAIQVDQLIMALGRVSGDEVLIEWAPIPSPVRVRGEGLDAFFLISPMIDVPGELRSEI